MFNIRREQMRAGERGVQTLLTGIDEQCEQGTELSSYIYIKKKILNYFNCIKISKSLNLKN